MGLKYPLVTNHSQARVARHAISAAREARQAIPACKLQTSYPSIHCTKYTVEMRLQRPIMADKLTQQNSCRQKGPASSYNTLGG